MDESQNILIKKLLSDKRVIAEIHRHLWIESEKRGYDIGYEQAQEDWLKNFSRAWMEYHMPEELKNPKRPLPQAAPPKTSAQQSASSKTNPIRRRRAKSYFDT